MNTDEERGYRNAAVLATMQVRVHRTGGGRTYFYYPDVSARRAAELAAGACRAQCMADVDYFEVIDDSYDYDSPGMLIADWQGRPAITINTEMR